MSKESDIACMRHALSLACRNLGRTWPNPSVGCVIVKDGIVIGRGWTAEGGRPHAETQALTQAGEQARGATAYVTLEPCAHHGKTPPCADALMKAGLARIIIACQDPDPRTAGQGIARLKEAGITVETGILEQEAKALNAGFFLQLAEKRPLVSLKLATSADGHMALANGESKWITGTAARECGHRLRASHDAILTGSGTVLDDNPSLTCRLTGLEASNPVRVILDSQLKTPDTSIVISTAEKIPTWVFHTQKAASPKGKATLFSLPDEDGHVPLRPMLAKLAEQGITRLLVEAGPRLSTAFVKAGLADRIYWFRSPALLGADGKAAIAPLGLASLAKAPIFRRVALETLGPDVLEILECSRA